MEAESFYDDYAPREWERLDEHRTEYAVTMRALSDFLPRPPCSVLDIGGGPGRYSIALAGRGYRVTLLDVSQGSLNLARVRASEAGATLSAYVHANALDLRVLGSQTFDAVLLMGPLYHLLLAAERVHAVNEAVRVLTPGGRLFATFITRFAPFRLVSRDNPAWLAANLTYAQQLLDSGLHDKPTRFARAYYSHPAEVVPLMEGCGLRTSLLVGCEGVVAGDESGVNRLDGQEWDAWVDLNYRLGRDPSLLGASDHLLYVGEKV